MQMTTLQRGWGAVFYSAEKKGENTLINPKCQYLDSCAPINQDLSRRVAYFREITPRQTIGGK